MLGSSAMQLPPEARNNAEVGERAVRSGLGELQTVVGNADRDLDPQLIRRFVP